MYLIQNTFSDAGITFFIVSDNNSKLKLGCKRDGEEVSKGKAS